MTPDEYRERMFSVFSNLKNNRLDPRTDSVIPILRDGQQIADIRSVTVADMDDPEAVHLLSEWRDKNAIWFPAQFKVTDDRTKKWLKDGVIDKDDRILFWIVGLDGSKYGHIGLYRINAEDFSCEIDNVMRGSDRAPKGIMYDAMLALMRWSLEILKNKAIELTVFADNSRAIALYERGGFKTVKRIPLKKVVDKEAVMWEELSSDDGHAERYNLKMRVEF